MSEFASNIKLPEQIFLRCCKTTSNRNQLHATPIDITIGITKEALVDTIFRVLNDIFEMFNIQ